jgi:hypothetical protein
VSAWTASPCPRSEAGFAKRGIATQAALVWPLVSIATCFRGSGERLITRLDDLLAWHGSRSSFLWHHSLEILSEFPSSSRRDRLKMLKKVEGSVACVANVRRQWEAVCRGEMDVNVTQRPREHGLVIGSRFRDADRTVIVVQSGSETVYTSSDCLWSGDAKRGKFCAIFTEFSPSIVKLFTTGKEKMLPTIPSSCALSVLVLD